MGSSFSTGALYIVRHEVQATGLDWDTFWISPLKNDPMNFGIAFWLLIFDAILYAIVGYILQRVLNDPPSRPVFSTGSLRKGVQSNIGVIIENVSHFYTSNGRLALNNVKIQLQKGQITSLLGANGAGKTTLM